MMKAPIIAGGRRALAVTLTAVLGLCAAQAAHAQSDSAKAAADKRIEDIHKTWVFADMHAHPSHFHRDNVTRFDSDELGRYRRGRFDIIVAAATADNVMSGNYTNRDGSYVEPGVYKPKPGDFFKFQKDRIERAKGTILYGDADLADRPESVLKSKQAGRISLLLAMEGAEGLEEDIRNVKVFYDQGVRLIQPVHLEPNGSGSSQVFPYTPSGLTDFGKALIVESNRLGIVIDLAHMNTRSQLDALKVSTQPLIFSHTASQAKWKGDRSLSDGELRAIADKGGVIGVWTNIQSFATVKDMVDDIDYIRKVVGPDHVGIGTDLRGLDGTGYTRGFGAEANFVAIERELVSRGYSDEDIGKILGGNFFRVWQQVTAAAKK